MSDGKNNQQQDHIDNLYEESSYWHVNTGDETIHAKRIPGKYRNIKWFTATVWLTFLLGPYLRWNDSQAILLNIPDRQFHFFNITVLPQDVWMLSLLLLFFAILLAVVTSIAGRVFCGYFCFQTLWTDLFTLIETKLEGSPAQRQRLDKAALSVKKIRIKTIKHTAWLLIGSLTGLTFCAWFTDAYQLWADIISLNAAMEVWVSLGVFTAGTYLFAGFMREQVCFWLCPYARIQGVMIDSETILPTYDVKRGEPRGKLKRHTEENQQKGDCIDCHLCVGVCPTGVDIRNGQQEGCITCGLCLDACDSIMDKVGKPRGLIRYASLDEMEGKPTIALHKRPRVIIYAIIMLMSLGGIGYGLNNIGAIELQVLHERQPLYILRSDGSVQNKYELKVLNKLDKTISLYLSADGPDGLQLVGADKAITVKPYSLQPHTVFLRLPKNTLREESISVTFKLTDKNDIHTEYKSMFIGPLPKGQ
jgi:cytochrome c oxidase accessory protein FixG